MGVGVQVVPIDSSHRDMVDRLMCEHFGSARVVSRGVLHEAASLPGLVGIFDGAPAGFLLYDLQASECEIVALISVIRRRGVARALVSALGGMAGEAGAKRLVLVTTNDNVGAQTFYSAMGFSLVRVHTGAVGRARLIKPEIPLVGEGGVAIEDELEYELCAGATRGAVI